MGGVASVSSLRASLHGGVVPEEPVQRGLDLYMTAESDSDYQSTLDAVYVYVLPWLEFPIVVSYNHFPQGACICLCIGETVGVA